MSKWCFIFALAALGHFARYFFAGFNDVYLALAMAEAALFFVFDGRKS